MDCYSVLAALSHRYPVLKGRSSTRYSPVRRSTQRPKSPFSHDLHVLSTSPAFNLSQDQTLQFEILVLLKPHSSEDKWVCLHLESPDSLFNCQRPCPRFSSRGSVSTPTHSRCQRLISSTLNLLFSTPPKRLAPSGGEATYWFRSPSSTTFFKLPTLSRLRVHSLRSLPLSAAGRTSYRSPATVSTTKLLLIFNFPHPLPGRSPSASGRGCLPSRQPRVNHFLQSLDAYFQSRAGAEALSPFPLHFKRFSWRTCSLSSGGRAF
jgi:hypothetical protein